MGVHDFSIVTDEIHWGINHCFGNKSKSIPHTELVNYFSYRYTKLSCQLDFFIFQNQRAVGNVIQHLKIYSLSEIFYFFLT